MGEEFVGKWERVPFKMQSQFMNSFSSCICRCDALLVMLRTCS